MKPVLAALVSTSLAAMPLAAAAQHHGGGHASAGGGSWSGHAGAWSGSHMGSGTWSGGFRNGGFGTGFRGGFPHHHFRGGGFPVFGAFGLGLAFGSAWDPWYWDYPYYGPAYTVVEHDYAYPPPDDGY